jgi:tetratricopeptide (TPR) repeat protein
MRKRTLTDEDGRRNFFISYTGADQAWGEWVAWQLEQAGYSVVLQAWDFEPGDNFVIRMRDALDRSDRTISLISAAYLASPYCTDEWTGAFLHDPDGKNRLLQVRIEACDLPRLLRSQVYIDLVGASPPEAQARLLNGVKTGRRRPTSEPPFPRRVDAQPRFPGHGPAITNLPPRNPAFSGRNGPLGELHRVLTAASAAAVVQETTVHGMGGVGKSQLAIEYAYRHATEYDIIWWIAAERPVTIPAQLAGLARELDVVEVDDQAELLANIWSRLRKRDRWLLIYDNAESFRSIAGYRPPSGEGRVLITSRSSSWGAAPSVRLDVLRREEAVMFLRRRTGASDIHTLDALADALGDLPLALDQAAAYMDETKTTASDYLALFRDHAMELLALGEPTTTEQTVATVWQVSLNRVRVDEPATQDLLNLCAFLAPDAIPRALFSDHTAVLPEALGKTVVQRLPYNAAVSIIGRYSLMTVTPDSLAVHRLVQTVIRASLTSEVQRLWARVAVRLISTAFPRGSSNPATWPACAPLLPHALVTVDHAEALRIESETTALLLNEVGVYLWARSELIQAKELHERALALDEAQFGSDHVAVANSLNNLGLVLWDLVDSAGARAVHERALAIREARLGAHHPAVAASLNNLGAALWDLAELQEARAAHERALAIMERQLGDDHPAVAASLNNLGAVLVDLGELARARAVYERALEILDRRVSDHRDGRPGALRLSSSASLGISDVGELAVARAVLDPALPDRQPRLVGGNPPTAAMSQTVDAGTNVDPSELTTTSAALPTPVLPERQTPLGSDDPTMVKILDNLGVALSKLGELAEARKTFERALAIREARLGSNHPDVGWSLTNLGVVLSELGELEDARTMLERGLAVRQARLGADHPDVATNLSSLGTVLGELGELVQARTTLERALGIREQRLGHDHPATRTTRDNLTAVIEMLGHPSRGKGTHSEC